MQLVAYGAQDVYLTGDPQITFFKVVYRRHTNFAIEAIQQSINGYADFGRRVTCTVSRSGDLIGNIFVQLTLPTLSVGTITTGAVANLNEAAWTNAIGHVLLKEIQLEIGGQKIDTQYGIWLEIWTELTSTAEKIQGYNQMVGRVAPDQTPQAISAATQQTLQIPLMFWFCRNPGLALPLISLQYHDTKIIIDFEEAIKCVVGLQVGGARSTDNFTTLASPPAFIGANIYVDYYYLDTNERRKFASMSHEYLIPQLQFSKPEQVRLDKSNHKQPINLVHPVKELIWVFRRSDNYTVGTQYNDWYNFSAAPAGSTSASPFYVNLLQSAKIIMNGNDRFSIRIANYFRLTQPWQYHTRVPNKQIYVYSFALRPEEHQPSGTCNFSRIDNSQLEYNIVTDDPLTPGQGWADPSFSQFMLFALNYNVLRVMSGMGGLAYSN